MREAFWKDGNFWGKNGMSRCSSEGATTKVYFKGEHQ
jgi:hypothetical protein